MDAIDVHILDELQNNARLTNQELADRVGLSPSPCLRRVRALEESGVISGYGARIDHKRVGLTVHAFVSLTLTTHTLESVEAVEQRIRDIPNVVDAYLMSGETDYLINVLVEDLDAFQVFVRTHLRSLPQIGAIHTSFAYGTVKEPSNLPIGGSVATR